MGKRGKRRGKAGQRGKKRGNSSKMGEREVIKVNISYFFSCETSSLG